MSFDIHWWQCAVMWNIGYLHFLFNLHNVGRAYSLKQQATKNHRTWNTVVNPANTRRRTNVDLSMLQHRRRWSIIKSTMVMPLVFADTRRRTNVDLSMLQHRRRWSIIKSTMVMPLVFADTRRRTNVDLSMLQHRRRWSIIKSTMVMPLVFADVKPMLV